MRYWIHNNMTTSCSWMHVLAELAPLDGLNNPLSRSARLSYTCISVSKKYLALGSNTGGIYIFSRDTLKHLQVVYADVETNMVTVTALSPNNSAVAFSTSSGQVIIMELNIERRCKPERLHLNTDHVGFTVTALHWDQSSSKVFIGDSIGKISVAYVPTSKAKTLFTQPSEVIVRLDSAVVQLDWWDKKLLVSTLKGSYLLNTNRHQYSQIGKKPRDGEFGSCFYVEPSSQYPVVYCARPGSRIWEVDFEGNVLNTHLCKKLLAIPSLPVIKFRSESAPHFDVPRVVAPQSVVFNKMFVIGAFLVTWSEKRIYVIDPARVKIILWTEQDTVIKDIVIQGNEIYIYHVNNTVNRFHLLPLQKCLHLLCARRKWSIAGEVICYCCNLVSCSVIQQHVKTDTLLEIIDKLKNEDHKTTAEKLQMILDEFTVKDDISGNENVAEDVGNEKSSQIVRLSSGIFVVSNGEQDDQMMAVWNDELSSGVQASKRNDQRNNSLSKYQENKNEANSFLSQNKLLTITKEQTEAGLSENLQVTENKNMTNNDMSGNELLTEKKVQADNGLSAEHLVAIHKNICLSKNKCLSVEKDQTDNDVTVINDHEGNNEIPHVQLPAVNKNKCSKSHSENQLVTVNNDVFVIAKKDQTENCLQADQLTGLSKDQKSDGLVADQLVALDEDCARNGLSEVELDPNRDNITHSIYQKEECHTENNSAIVMKDQPSMDLMEHQLMTAGKNWTSSDVKLVNVITKKGHLDKSSVMTEELQLIIRDNNSEDDKINFDKNLSLSKESQIISTDEHKFKNNVENQYSDLNTDDGEILNKGRSFVNRHNIGVTTTNNALTLVVNSSFSLTDLKCDVQNNVNMQEQMPNFVTANLECKTSLLHDIEEHKLIRTLATDVQQPDLNVDLLNSERTDILVNLAGDKSNDAVNNAERSNAEHEILTGSGIPVPTEDVGSCSTIMSLDNALNCAEIETLKKLELSDTSSSDIVYKSHGSRKRSTSTGSLKKLKKKEKKVIPSIHFEEETDVNLYTKIDLEPDSISIDTLSSIEEGEITPDTVSLADFSSRTKNETDQQIIPSLIQRLSAGGVTPDEFSSRESSPSHSQGSPTSSSPRAALMHVKESISSKTKFLIDTLYKKSLMVKSVTSVSDHDSKETTTETVSSTKPETTTSFDKDFNLDTDDIGLFKHNIDFSSLQTAIASAKTKLQDFFILMNPGVLKSHLQDWVIELHKTMQLLQEENDKQRRNLMEQRKRNWLKLKCEQLVYGNEEESEGLENNIKVIHSSSQKITEENQCQVDQSLSDTVSQSSEQHATSFAYSEQYKSVSQSSDKENTEIKFNFNSSVDNCMNSDLNISVFQNLETDVLAPEDDLSANDWSEVCHVTTPFIIPKQLEADISELANLCFEIGCHGNVIKFVSNKTAYSESVKQKVQKTDSIENNCVENSHQNSYMCHVTGFDEECSFDREMAQFVKCYFHFLDFHRMKQALQAWPKNLFDTWSALVSCSQEIGKHDQIAAKLENKDVQGVTDLFRSGIISKEQAFLGHFSRLFSINASHAVEFACEMSKQVSCQDIYNLCRMYNKPVEQLLSKYVIQRLGEISSSLELHVIKEVCPVSWLQIITLDSLLSDATQDKMEEVDDKPSPGSHLIIMANETVIESVLDLCIDPMEEDALGCCKQHRYWKGCLKVLKKKNDWKEMLWLIVQLGDISLLDNKLQFGYAPQSTDQWHYFLWKFSETQSHQCNKQSDWSVSLTWQSICELMVKKLGPVAAVSLLEKLDIPQTDLSPHFYQMCIMESKIQQRQKLVLHNMLEKIDTYLWAKRSPHMAPQLLYAVTEEKKSQSTGDDSYQELFRQLSGKENHQQIIEDSESHWGIVADVNSCCCSCSLKLTETVSLAVPGVLVFPCGHAFHKFCIPQKMCLLCLD